MSTRFTLGLFSPCVFLLVLCSGCANDQKIMAVADQVHTGVEPAVIEDPELTAYLQQIGDRIIETAKTMDAQGY